jgi:hypothetical protein
MRDIRGQIERLRDPYGAPDADEIADTMEKMLAENESLKADNALLTVAAKRADSIEKHRDQLLAVVEAARDMNAAWEKFEPFKYTVTQEDIDRGYFIIDDRDGNPCRIAITGVPGDIISWKDDG